MTSRTRVPRWTPPFREALRLAWRPALAYLVFSGLGSLVLLLTVAGYDHGNGKDKIFFFLGLTAGMVGILLGQAISILRFRALPVFIVSAACVAGAIWLMVMLPGHQFEYFVIPTVFFCFAFPCGLLSLMHRWELFASFWPAVGWIGGVFVILNHENRVGAWEKEKVTAWLPLPLAYLACFLVLWLLYLAAKQASRVEMWQALSGAAARRITKAETRKNRVAALPRRNLLPLLAMAALLFVGVAALSPYLWRTGRGEHGETKPREVEDRPADEPRQVRGEGLMKQLEKLAEAAKNTLPKLWPLLFLLVLYRPTKRALLLTHLKSPIVPTPPSERIDNLWEYVRIAAEDASVIPTAADSVEQLVTRIHQTGRSSPGLAKAADIYIRTRYGFVVQRGDAASMRGHATEAAAALRKDLGLGTAIKNWWRPLS